MARVSTAPSGAMTAHSLYVLQTVGLHQTNCPTSSLAFGRLPTIPFLRNSNSAYARQGLRVIMTKRLPSVVSAAAAGEESEVAGLLEPPSDDAIDKEFQDSLQQDNATENDTELTDLKQGLVDSFYGTQRGLRANSDTRAEINELVTQLEAKNPTPVPTEALTLLNGKWILAYTSNSELFPFLALGSLPLVKVGEISQTIDALAFTVENCVTFEGPLASTSLKAAASFEVRSPKRVQIKFEQGIIGTPQLTDSLDVPASVDVLGQTIDLKPIWGVLHPLQDAANSVARTISGQPPLKFPIQADRAQSWLLTTYLDEDLRISRGDGGSVFVLIKENSALLY